jgi:hypothetical protein
LIPRAFRTAALVTVAILAFGVALKLVGVWTFPTHVDANFYLNIGTNALLDGDLTPRMWRLPDDSGIIAGSGTGYGILLLTGWFRLFGVSVLAGRLLMVILGVVFTVVIALAASVWWQDRYVGVAAGLFAGVSTSPFFAFQVRMDMAGYLAYALVLWGLALAIHHKRAWGYGVVGLGLVAAAEFHILALVYIVGVTLMLLVEVLLDWRTTRRLSALFPFVWYAVGGLVGGIIYAAVHILPNPSGYFLIATACPACDPRGWPKELERFRNFYAFRPVEAALVTVSLIAALTRRTPADRRWLLLFGGGVLAYPLISPPSQIEYISHMAPLFVMGIATLTVHGFRQRGAFSPRGALVVHAVALMLLFVQAGRLWFVANLPDRTPPEIVALREYDLPYDTVIMGNFLLYEYLIPYTEFLSFDKEDVYTLTLRGEDYPTFWAREAPTVFIGDPTTNAELVAYLEAADFVEVTENLWLHPNELPDGN